MGQRDGCIGRRRWRIRASVAMCPRYAGTVGTLRWYAGVVRDLGPQPARFTSTLDGMDHHSFRLDKTEIQIQRFY